MTATPSYRPASGQATPDTPDETQTPLSLAREAVPTIVVAELRPALLPVEAAAEYLAIGRSRMFELLAGPDPVIPSLIISGRQRRVRVSDLDRFIAQRLAENSG
jgi:hypothetical protein